MWMVYGFSVMLLIRLSLGYFVLSVCVVCCIRLFGFYVLVVFLVLGVLVIGNSVSVGMFSCMYLLVSFSSRLIDSCCMFGIEGIFMCWFLFLIMNVIMIRLFVSRVCLCINVWENVLWCMW